MIDMSVDLAGMRLPNPLMTAFGLRGERQGAAPLLRHRRAGCLRHQDGAGRSPVRLAAPPRMAETPSGMLNSIGLQGPGIAAFARQRPGVAQVGGGAGARIHRREHRRRVRRRGRGPAPVAGVRRGRRRRGQHLLPQRREPGTGLRLRPAVASAKVIALVREKLPRDIPIFAKLSPDVTDIVEIARACVKAGADGLTMINTLLAMVIDTDLLRPQVAGVTGGLSGPAIRPVAVRAIWQVRAAMLEGRIPTVPIIGVGGVRTGDDALQLVAAGASAIQVGTATFNDPTAPIRVNRELAAALQDRGFARFSDAVGIAHTRLDPRR